MALKLTVDSWIRLVDGARERYRKGDLLDITRGEAERLLRIGAAVDTDKNAEPEFTPTHVEEVQEENEFSEEIAFPKSAAKLDIWRAFGKQNGVDVSGLSKAEIRAAVEAKINN